MRWNVGGWGKGVNSKIKEEIVQELQFDVIGVCESFLIGDEILDIDG